jgi:hypothetical protein
MSLVPRAPLSPPSDVGRETAHQLLASHLRDGMDESARIEMIERLGVCIPEGLSRWFGPYGALALVTRALTSARAKHAALAPVSVTTDAPARAAVLAGIGESARLHGSAAVIEGFVAWAAALSDLLGRLIGEDLASRLLRQCAVVADGLAMPTERASAPTDHTTSPTPVDAPASGADVLPKMKES